MAHHRSARGILILFLVLAMSLFPGAAQGGDPCQPVDVQFQCPLLEDRIWVTLSKVEMTDAEVTLTYAIHQRDFNFEAFYAWPEVSEDLSTWTPLWELFTEGPLRCTPGPATRHSITLPRPPGKRLFFRVRAEGWLSWG